MNMIRIDRDMLIEDILAIRAIVSFDNLDAKDRIDKLISLISNLPIDEKKSQFPRTNIRRL
jgi:hypothetical protein